MKKLIKLLNSDQPIYQLGDDIYYLPENKTVVCARSLFEDEDITQYDSPEDIVTDRKSVV